MRYFNIILLESPKNLEIYFDNLTLKPGELFKGIKEIPFGVHLLSTKLLLGKSSSYIFESSSSTLVYQWNSNLDNYERQDPETESMYSASYEEFLPMMVTYDQSSLQSWQELTNYITQATLDKLHPLSNQILSSSKEYDKDPSDFESFSSKTLIYYTQIPKRYSKPNLTPSELTLFNHDKSKILEDLLKSEFKSTESLLGELQFSFISLLLSENSESFNQWKELLILTCNSEQAASTNPNFFIKLVPVLYSEVKNLPKDLIFDPFLSSSFITSSLKSLVLILQDPALPRQLQLRAGKLSDLLRSEFGIFDFEMLNEDEAPVIVET